MRSIFLLLLVGCASEFDPTGFWAMTFDWKSGDCGETDSTQISVEVARVSQGVSVTSNSAAYPNVSGSFQIGDDWAIFDGELLSERDLLASFTATVDGNHAITGDGYLAPKSAMSIPCFQPFTITGTLE